MKATKLWNESFHHDQIRHIAAKIKKELSGDFCLWLIGPMGAGKTTLTRAILREFGLPESVPVLSPTYTYINSYSVGPTDFHHMDLFRIDETASVDEIIDVSSDSRHFFIEWPDQMPKSPEFQPTHRVELRYSDHSEDEREISLYSYPPIL